MSNGGNTPSAMLRLKEAGYTGSTDPKRNACRNCVHGEIVLEGVRSIKRIKCQLLRAWTNPGGVCDDHERPTA